MANDVYRSFLPVTVIFAVLGYPVLILQRPKLQKLFRTYCNMMTVVQCTHLICAVVMNVLTLEYDSVSLRMFAARLSVLIVMLCYRVEYVLCGDGNILENIDYVDRKLESVNGNVPHRRNNLKCTAFTIISFLVTALMIYKTLRTLKYPERIEMVKIIGFRCYTVHLTILSFYTCIIRTRLICLLYFLLQRFRLIRKAISLYNKRNIAWSDPVPVRDMNRLSGNSIIDQAGLPTYCKILICLYSCSFDAFQSSKKFYSSFMIVQIISVCVFYPVYIIFNLLRGNNMIYRLITLADLCVTNLPFVVCIFLARELDSIHSAVHSLCNTERRKALQRDVKNWLWKCVHDNTKFDCGFLDIDIALYAVIVDYLLLFLFAMFPAV